MTFSYGSILVTIALLAQMVLLAKEKIYYVDFERVNVTYWNPKYLKDVNVSCRRYGRRDPVHYCFIHAELLHPGGNNVLVDMKVYQFLSNEYRRSFVEFQAKLCDFYFNIPCLKLFLERFKGIPTTCPIPKGIIHVDNLSMVDIPVLKTFPFQKGRVFVNITGKVTPDSQLEIVANGFVDGVIKQMWR